MNELEFYNSSEYKLVEKATYKNIPINGIFELTPVCNLSCEMCYVHLSPSELSHKGNIRSLDEWLEIAREMQQAGTLFLLITGGEPLLYPHFKELYLALQSLGMILTINTNGTLIDEEWAEFFAKHRPRRINITMYGCSEKTYEHTCHNGPMYEKMLRGIMLLNNAGIDVKINGSIIKSNEKDALGIVKFARKNNIFYKLDSYMYPSTLCSSETFDHIRLTAKEAAKVRFEIQKATCKDDKEFYEQLLTTYLNVCNPREWDDNCQVRCRAGRSSFVIHWDGTMTGCTILREPGENVFEQGFTNSWNKLVEYTKKITLSSKCSCCDFRDICQTCAACAYSETGEFQGVPEYMCQYTKEYYELALQYLKSNEKK